MYTANELLEKINSYILEFPDIKEPAGLYDPIEYVLSNGGKRIRPVLLSMAYNLYKDDIEHSLAPAAAIEIYHNCTLLHDDLMDRSDMRRGKKTVHKKWNDNTAILSGDAMLVLAYRYIGKCPPEVLAPVLNIFTDTLLGICEGQQYDMDFENRNDVSASDYIEMIRLKTAILLAGSLKIGAVLGGASEQDADKLYRFGEFIGLAFQLKDDFLDVYGDPAVFGKKIGGDILCNKKTYMLIKAAELANNRQSEELNKWINADVSDPAEKVKAVTGIYDELGIGKICEKKMTEYYDQAIQTLNEVTVAPEKKAELKTLVENLMYREL